MAEIRIGEMRSEVEVTDTDALLSPRVLARIVAAVERELAEKSRGAEDRLRETRIGTDPKAGGR